MLPVKRKKYPPSSKKVWREREDAPDTNLPKGRSVPVRAGHLPQEEELTGPKESKSFCFSGGGYGFFIYKNAWSGQ